MVKDDMIRKKLEDYQSHIRNLKTERVRLNKELTKLKDEKRKILSDKRNIIEDKDRVIKELKSRLSEAGEFKDLAKEKKALMTDLEEENEHMRQQIEELNNENQNLIMELDELKGREGNNVIRVSEGLAIHSNSDIVGDIHSEGHLTFGDEVKVRGTLYCKDDVAIGRSSVIDGDVCSEGGTVVIGASSTIKGMIKAGEVNLSEKVTAGAIESNGNVSIGPNSKVEDISALGDVILLENARVEGSVEYAGELKAESRVAILGSVLPRTKEEIENEFISDDEEKGAKSWAFEDGSEDDGSEDDESEDDGSEDDGSEDDGSEDDESEEDGSEEDGSEEDESEDDEPKICPVCNNECPPTSDFCGSCGAELIS